MTVIILPRASSLLAAIAWYSSSTVLAASQHVLDEGHFSPTKKQLHSLRTLEHAHSEDVGEIHAPFQRATMIFSSGPASPVAPVESTSTLRTAGTEEVKGEEREPCELGTTGATKEQPGRFRDRKPAGLSNLRFTATDSVERMGEAALQSRWSPIASQSAILQARAVSPRVSIRSPIRASPRSPRFNASVTVVKSAHSPLFLAVEDGFRSLMSGGTNGTPKTPSSPSSKKANGLLGPGIACSGLASPRSPRSPRRFAGFVIPKSKKGTTKAVLHSPRKTRFDTSSPRKATFDDEGFNDDVVA
ncbi:hypothetical protein P389DRAFT_196180 [Cystobasidium minutum MCA 4210]|uniref:uncharacterized protein n=1 Tax=Cystobasidium minutum MCA 4210 TaxID=1397322 RepID=UPI0034CF131B|eukprot:jgi/Rhomi1/196180/gm1.4394_g